MIFSRPSNLECGGSTPPWTDRLDGPPPERGASSHAVERRRQAAALHIDVRPDHGRLFAILVLIASLLGSTAFAATVNVRDHGAKGDGVTLDSPAINAAIDSVAKSGGGTVLIPAGRYLSFSLRLQSNLTLQFEAGAVLLAADPSAALGHYDEAEPNEFTAYQDFGHSHWHNSLIWGENLENVSLVGPGRIDGSTGLTRRGPPARRDLGSGTNPPPTLASNRPAGESFSQNMDGLGNKAIALKNCRSVTLRDFAILNGGHFAVLATGVDHLTLDNLKVDTNRDGFDIDGCRHVRIAHCTVNSPNDDAIVLKSSFALGTDRATENVTITDCTVSGFDAGSVLAGTFLRTMSHAPDRDGPTGRIKLGTESNGGFRNIIIANCTFERSRGLALETVDGGTIEDVIVTGLTMREVMNSPIFIRLGNRARGPAGTPIGAIRRVHISHVTASDVDGRFPVIIAGLSGHPVEDVTLNDIQIVSRGGITSEQVAQQSSDLVNTFFLRGKEAGLTGPRSAMAVPERADAYPEPSMFGLLPAAAVYARHVSHLSMRDITYAFIQPDSRPLVVLEDVRGATLENVRAPHSSSDSALVLRHVRDLEIHRSLKLADKCWETVDDATL